MTDGIERELDLAADPSRVWRSLTHPELLAQWLADEATLELRPGGEASFRIGDELRTGWIEEVRPPTEDQSGPGQLTFWWAPADQPASRVQLTLTATERGTTRLRIVETRPLEILDLAGLTLPGHGGARYGPALVAA
jgi:uncharacterized protein YndB with AHSA1/START domain